MRTVFLAIAVVFLINFHQPNLFSEESFEVPVCEKCCERHEGRMKLAAILTGIAELARSFAVIFANPNNKQQCNEAVCGIIAGACTIAAQATRDGSFPISEEEMYEMLSEPATMDKIREIFAQELELAGCDEESAALTQINRETK